MSRRRSSARPPASRAASPEARGRLRLIGGRFKRRLLPVLDSPGLRPTPDRVRETLFNWLAFDIAGSRVLDLYSGTGALGLEALSRGAAEAIFVERERAVAHQLRDNLTTLGVAADIIERDALGYLRLPPAAAFDVVFLDPPFRQGLATQSCEQLEAGGWLSATALIYVEAEAELALHVPDNWRLHRQTRAGESQAYLYRRVPLAAATVDA